MKKYVNRYQDEFVFTEDEDHNILWEGNFDFCRIGMPNDYTKAYKAYLNDREDIDEDKLLSLEEFKSDVHEYYEGRYVYPEYVKLVESLIDKIDMVDPSGGPYVSIGVRMDSLGFKDYIVKDFERIDTGYKIITEKCSTCHLPGSKHKASCSSKKITAFYSQMEKEVRKSNSNLNQ